MVTGGIMSKYMKNGKWRKKGSPVWLWKWTKDAHHVYKQKRKDGKL